MYDASKSHSKNYAETEPSHPIKCELFFSTCRNKEYNQLARLVDLRILILVKLRRAVPTHKTNVVSYCKVQVSNRQQQIHI